MALSIRDIIQTINTTLEGVLKGSKIYSVATLTEREGKGHPVVDSYSVAYDDSYAMQGYHRIAGVTITYLPGYGNKVNTVNTYQVSFIVFNNEKLTRLKQDEIALIIQSVFSTLNIHSAQVLPTQIILNSQQIFAAEYKGATYALNEYQSLMQLNYTVSITYQGNCFTVCPEDFSNCKT